jgi:hypothetical protein
MSFAAKTVSACIVTVSAMLATQPASPRSADMTSVLTGGGLGHGVVVANEAANVCVRNNNFSNRSQRAARGKKGG